MEKGDDYEEKKQFGGIIKVKAMGNFKKQTSNEPRGCKNVASSFFPPKHQIVLAGQLSFSGKSGVRLLDCTSSILIQDGGGATETQRDGLRWRTSPQQHRRSLVPGLPKIRRNLADSYMAATSI